MKALIYLSAILICLACNRKISAKGSSSVAVDSSASVFVSSDSQQITPLCIMKKIDSIKQDHVWNPPAEIHEYENDGKKFYVISADCCDFFTTAVDENCKHICAPSGGFTGRGDGKCPEFFKQAKHVRLVWKDDRARK